MAGPDVVSTVAELRRAVGAWRGAGERVALVPTMGALHAGHVALVEAATAAADRVVVSIFVNPTQFAPHEDLDSYPRTFEADLAALRAAKADLVYAPAASEMYPDGNATVVTVGGPSEGLESVARPHFFAGVATVVSRLLIQCAPDVAFFGEKDFQQLAVIRRMVRDLSIPTEIRAIPTVREPDGLALSSRNVYLDAEHRGRAPAMHAALAAAADEIRGGGDVGSALDRAKVSIERAGFTVDYVECRNPLTLEPIDRLGPEGGRLLAAARIAGVRLIDNVSI